VAKWFFSTSDRHQDTSISDKINPLSKAKRRGTSKAYKKNGRRAVSTAKNSYSLPECEGIGGDDEKCSSKLLSIGRI
jgi:hypothetical protein